MYAYLMTGVVRPGHRAHPYWPVLAKSGGQWMVTDLRDGLLLTLAGYPASRQAYGEAISVPNHDNLQLLLPADMDQVRDQGTWRSLARPDAPPSVDVALICGHTASVGLGLAAPQTIALTTSGAATIVGHATDLGRAAWAWHEECLAAEEGTPLTEEHALQQSAWLCYLGLAACYILTPEWMTALGILSTGDLGPLQAAIWGADPKAVAAAGATLPSSAAAASDLPASPPPSSTP